MMKNITVVGFTFQVLTVPRCEGMLGGTRSSMKLQHDASQRLRVNHKVRLARVGSGQSEQLQVQIAQKNNQLGL